MAALYCTLELAEYLPSRYRRGTEPHFFQEQTITDPDLLPLGKIITPVTHCFNKGHSDKMISRL